MPKPTQSPAGDWPKLSAPAQRALAGAGYQKLSDLAKVTEAEVLALHGMGPNGIQMLKTALTARGLSFKPAKTAKK